MKKVTPLYRARPGTPFRDSDAAIIGPACEALAREKGVVQPRDLVEVASKRSHVLHRYFDWDDSSAAKKYRLSQARHLLSSFTVVIEKNEAVAQVRGLQYLSSQHGYVSSSVISNDLDFTKELIDRAYRDALLWAERYKSFRKFAKLSGIFEAVDAVSSSTSPKIKKVS